MLPWAATIYIITIWRIIKMGRLKLKISIVRLFVCLMFSLFLISCGEKEKAPEKVIKSSQPAETDITITKIDDKDIDPNVMPEVGMQVKVELTTTNPDVVVCVLVHPITSDQWWVQNLPALPNEISKGVWSWQTLIYCGTEVAGRKEQYEIIATAEREQGICSAGNQIKVDEANNLLRNYHRSKKITLQRVKD
jgi:hypothetical protein